ncbi:MAG: hypothetical protein Q9207_004696 [Kuettlingeria erythrocarpa]
MRAKPRSRPEHLSINALPDFSFHPSPPTSETPNAATPSCSPTKSQIIHPHSSGHRRNGSEFIGGNGRNAVTGLMSTSPTKGEGALPPPPGVRTGPPAGRRGHAHRRSGAISSHDVSSMLKPTEVRSGSAPTTPCDPSVQPNLPPLPDRSVSQPATVLPLPEAAPAFHHRRMSSNTGHARPRVGFSDHIEFIPRPLSTISSETSSSLSTIRPSHSVTGSISSVISNGNSSPPSARSSRILQLDHVEEGDTAVFGVLDVPGTIPAFSDQPSEEHHKNTSAASNTGTHSKAPNDFPLWSEIFKDSRNEYQTHRSGSSDDAPSFVRPSGTPDTLRNKRRPLSAIHSPIARPRTSPEPKISKRQKKGKSWAGSILARKARNSLSEDISNDFGIRTVTQSAPIAPDDLSLEQLNFDEDTTCVIDTAPSRAFKTSPAKVGSPMSRAVNNSPDLDSDESDQILDLDAVCVATPSGPNFEEVTGSHGLAARRRLHSSGATGGFDGPGMHYHRRAESAPELAPVNRRIFNPSGLSSSTTMADVFEEDEDEIEVDQKQPTKAQSSGSLHEARNALGYGLGVSNLSAGDQSGSSLTRRQRPTAATLSNDASTLRTYSAPSIATTPNPAALAAVEIVRAEEEPREAIPSKSANDSAVTRSLTSDPFITRPASAPLLYTLPSPHPTFATPDTYSSALSTPDFSQTSFEGPRVHTAASSITDRGTLSSFRAGDQGFDFRVSVDDVPSLTSSASTMASGYPARPSSSAPTRPSGDRPASLTGVVAPRTRPGNASKRSSLASLSRLVGGSHSERSKLNIEERVQGEDTEKAEKKKGRRISRLMRFWRSKEKAPSPS